mgnify:CR=1 FL=1
MYTVKRRTASIGVDEYLKEYVDVDKFIRFCEDCPNHNKVWTCPPFGFDVMAKWRKYDILDVYAEEISLDSEYAGRKCSKDEIGQILESTLGAVKERLLDEMLELEKKIPGSMALSAGSCKLCKECTRPGGGSCRQPEKARYSIEALGGDVGKTISSLMSIELEWMKEDTLPGKFVLVCGLLRSGEKQIYPSQE